MLGIVRDLHSRTLMLDRNDHFEASDDSRGLVERAMLAIQIDTLFCRES